MNINYPLNRGTTQWGLLKEQGMKIISDKNTLALINGAGVAFNLGGEEVGPAPEGSIEAQKVGLPLPSFELPVPPVGWELPPNLQFINPLPFALPNGQTIYPL
jgi:hypothetical protein